MGNFRKKIDPNYKANRGEPKRPRKVLLLWEWTAEGVAAVLYDIELDFHFCEVFISGNSASRASLPHIVTAGMISLAEAKNCVVTAVAEQTQRQPIPYQDLDTRGM